MQVRAKVLHVITRLDKGGSAQNTFLTCQELSRIQRPRIHITISMARWMALSTSVILTGLIVPEKGPRIKKDLSRVVICSHLAIEVWSRPPSPSLSSTWMGLVRRVVEMGTAMTSLAKRFRTSKETIKAGLGLVSFG